MWIDPAQVGADLGETVTGNILHSSFFHFQPLKQVWLYFFLFASAIPSILLQWTSINLVDHRLRLGWPPPPKKKVMDPRECDGADVEKLFPPLPHPPPTHFSSSLSSTTHFSLPLSFPTPTISVTKAPDREYNFSCVCVCGCVGETKVEYLWGKWNDSVLARLVKIVFFCRYSVYSYVY